MLGGSTATAGSGTTINYDLKFADGDHQSDPGYYYEVTGSYDLGGTNTGSYALDEITCVGAGMKINFIDQGGYILGLTGTVTSEDISY